MNKIDTSNELLVYQFGKGVKLLRPEQVRNNNKFLVSDTQHTVHSLLQLPMCVYFGNTESESVNLNECMVEIAGFESRHSAIGKTLRSVYSRKTADLINKNNIDIMKSNQIQILDEEAVRLNDDEYLSGISIKIPWYDMEDKIIGLFGFSIAIGKHSLADSLSSIADLGFLNLNKYANFLPGSQLGHIYLSKRETECLRLTIRGQSAKQIACVLGISRRTVEEYLNNTKLKLGVFSKAELIDKVIDYLLHNNLGSEN